MREQTYKHRQYNILLKEGFVSGIKKGWSGFIWMLKIVIPISFLTALLAWSGWLNKIDFFIQPAMTLINLPAMAALPLLIGMLSNLYGAIAAMAVLPLTNEQMTLIAIFLLTAHNLIQEGVIQGKSGMHPVKATLFRLTAAVITVSLVAQFFDAAALGPVTAEASVPVSQPFIYMLKSWSLATFYLCIKIFVIIMSILTLLEVVKSLGWIDHVVRVLTPVLKILGLRRNVGILWVTATVFGLAYGGAVIVEEAKQGHLTKDELEELHLSIGIHHSLIEDPALFLSLGLSAFWLWVPRLIMAMIAVRLLSLWHLARKRWHR
ncbi:MAG: nucleoside recognition domain-containing protein [Syntrophales bacterium]|nr:nucleoside recognition domain-containing protein [Syntrophales bacterium]